jgi:hypothetical protein
MSYTDAVDQIRELLERHLDSFEIAHRLHLDIVTVNNVVAFLST